MDTGLWTNAQKWLSSRKNSGTARPQFTDTSAPLIHPTINKKTCNNMQPRGYFFSWLDTGSSCKDLELVYWRSFEMNWQQTYRGSSLYVGCMRGTFVYANSLSIVYHAHNTKFVIVRIVTYWWKRETDDSDVTPNVIYDVISSSSW